MFERFLTVSTQMRTSLCSLVTHQRMKRQRKTSRASSHVLYSSLFIWIPLGLITLLGFKRGVSRKRYWLCIGIGSFINVLIGVITMRGGRIV